MATSLAHNYIHLIFSTKYRTPCLKEPYEKELHSYLSQICINNNCDVIIVGGYLDHVHIFCRLSKNIALSDLVKKLKANSSKWLKTKNHSLINFSWQVGYACFSVNKGQMFRLKRYIENQQKHHGRMSFKSELIKLLKENNIECDDKYLWD